MALYICKCGRQVNKSTSADNTGNRDTSDCVGCPYLLPWGPDKYIEGQGFRKEIQGYECRMSPTISYTTSYRGQANDKCTLHILSLDLDFLDTVQAWIDDHAADTLSAGFSRGSMRGTDFSDKGRYSLSISCAQNKKGMAAKAALIEQFFTGGRVRKDMTLAQEKAHILAAIKRGKENASKMKYTISEHQNGLMYAYYKGQFWFWHKDQNKWVPSAFATQQYDKAKAKDSGITPEMLLDNGSFNVLEEYQVPLQRRTALEALTPADSQVPAPDDRAVTKATPASAEAPEIVDECSESDEVCPYLLPLENSKKYSWQCSLCGDKFVNREICNKSFRGCGWYQNQQEKDARQDDEEEIPATEACQCRTCEHESCFAHGCAKECPANAEESCLTTCCPEYRSPCTDCRCPECDDDACPQAQCDGSDKGLGCMAPDDDCPPQSPTPAAPASPADAGAAAQSLSAAGPVSLEAKDMNVPIFDYSGLDEQTVEVLHLAENEIREARQVYICRVSAAVASAHDAVVANCENGEGGKFSTHEKTFLTWCASVGLKKDAAYRLLQVNALLSGATPEEQATLEAASPSLLYAAAKPSAPAELVQAVKDGDITTHKQYQEALAEIRARDAKITDLLDMSEAADRRADKAEQAAKDTARERDAALRRAAEAEKQRDGARDALQAAKLRGDKLKAENDALKAHPIEAQVVDEEEINRRAQARADELTAPLREELDALRARQPADLEEAEQAIRDAYDSAVYTGRVIESAWRSLCPLLPRMDADRRELALNQIVKIISTIQGECIQCL